MPSRRSVVAWLAAAVVAPAAFGAGTGAAFSDTTRARGNSFTAAPDWEAPHAVRSAVVAEADGGQPAAGAGYRVYAEVVDGGAPPSGTQAVAADASELTPGAAAEPLAAGTFDVAGTSYGYRSAVLTADAALAAGDHGYTLTLADAAANTRLQTGFVATSR
jgi:hypothetical protein